MSDTAGPWAEEARLRADLLARAAQVIKDMSAAQLAPMLQDIDTQQAPAPDLMTLLTEMAGLRQEVRLQRREVVRMREVQERANRPRTDDADTLQRALQDKLAPFLDVRDALARARDLAAAQIAQGPPSWWQRFKQLLRDFFVLNTSAATPAGAPTTAPQATQAIDAAILLQHVDRALARADVTPIAAFGEPFDPETMVAVAMMQTDAVAPGAVAQQIAGGFLIESKLWRPAQVVVNEISSEYK